MAAGGQENLRMFYKVIVLEVWHRCFPPEPVPSGSDGSCSVVSVKVQSNAAAVCAFSLVQAELLWPAEGEGGGVHQLGGGSQNADGAAQGGAGAAGGQVRCSPPVPEPTSHTHKEWHHHVLTADVCTDKNKRSISVTWTSGTSEDTSHLLKLFNYRWKLNLIIEWTFSHQGFDTRCFLTLT